MRTIRLLFTAAALVLCFGVVHAQPAEADGITVFAAASTTDALTEIAGLYEAEGNNKPALSFASSSTLAKQIEHGAPADVFLSANKKWMDYLEEKELIKAESRADLLGNRIVLIAPAASPAQPVAITAELDIESMLGKDGMLAVGDPAHVPVGTYAKAALEKLGLWSRIEKRVAPAKDVRAGLTLVEQGEAPLGIVYAGDAAVSDKVKILGTFPEDSHPPIVYPAAALKTDKSAEAKRFMAFMASPKAKEVWAKFGFEVR